VQSQREAERALPLPKSTLGPDSANGAEYEARGKRALPLPKSTLGPDSANGAEYESQGQARSEASASPLVISPNKRQGLKGRNSITPFQGCVASFGC